MGLETLNRRQLVHDLVTSRRFVIEEVLGKGGFGAAYRVRDTDSSRSPIGGPMCMKLSDDSTSWHAEAHYTGLLNHLPHSVNLLDSFPAHVTHRRKRLLRFALLLEYISTGTVRDACEREHSPLPWTENQVKVHCRGLLKPLAALHRIGVSHRDITPGNVFLATNNKLRLGDFGIAQAGLGAYGGRIDHAAHSHFMPPDAGTWWRPADDVYQIGLLMMTLLTSHEYGNDVTFPEITAMTSHGAGLREAIRGCLRPRPRRFADAQAVINALG